MSTISQQLTLSAQLHRVLLDQRPPPPGYDFRITEESDRRALAELYYSAYESDIVDTPAAAAAEIESTFAGEYGELSFATSPVVTRNGELVASVMTVAEAPWPDTPAGPFIIEAIVHPRHRRHGLAECALQRCASALLGLGHDSVALRVMSDNVAAMALYRKLGFTE